MRKREREKKTDLSYTLFRRLSTLSLCRALVSLFDVDAVPKPLRIRPAALVDWARHLPRRLYVRRGSWSRSVVGGLCSVFVIEVRVRRPWSRSGFEGCVLCSWSRSVFDVREPKSVIEVRIRRPCPRSPRPHSTSPHSVPGRNLLLHGRRRVRPGPDQLGSQALRLAMPPKMRVPCRSPWGAMMVEQVS